MIHIVFEGTFGVLWGHFFKFKDCARRAPHEAKRASQKNPAQQLEVGVVGPLYLLVNLIVYFIKVPCSIKFC